MHERPRRPSRAQSLDNPALGDASGADGQPRRDAGRGGPCSSSNCRAHSRLTARRCGPLRAPTVSHGVTPVAAAHVLTTAVARWGDGANRSLTDGRRPWRVRSHNHGPV